MKINADLSKRAEVHTPDMEWVPSPEPGVLRLEPGARFPEHTHGGGEEFLVLDGVFNDENGTYAKGAWLRQPAGSVHEPFSEEGCIFYVKKGHFV